VISEEKYHGGSDRHFHTPCCTSASPIRSQTELGGLVVAPEHRGALDRYGLLISYVRFLFIATHRELFRDEILPSSAALEPDGPALWGKPSPPLHRHELRRPISSSEDKSFVRDLFPSGSILREVLSLKLKAYRQSRRPNQRRRKMLRRVGFRYAERSPPSTAAPFRAPVEEITLVAATRSARISALYSGDAQASSGRARPSRPRRFSSSADPVRLTTTKSPSKPSLDETRSRRLGSGVRVAVAVKTDEASAATIAPLHLSAL